MSKLKDKLITLIMMIPIVLYALSFWPYLLWLAWSRVISLTRELRRQDLALKSR